MRILKFGGSSVATPERIRAVVQIVQATTGKSRVGVVVSAFGGVTDALLSAARVAAQHDVSYLELLTQLSARHLAAAAELALVEERADLEARLRVGFAELGDLLKGVYLLREASPRTRDRVASYGERWSAAVVAAALRAAGTDAADCDARQLIQTDGQFGNARLEVAASETQIQRHFAASAAGSLQVVTGFIAATAEGETTTLGRGGSDYTAAILGAALDADAVEIWTDVDGVMSADPRLVAQAASIATMSYDELMELSHFGAKVIYPPSVHPTRNRQIPLLIKNTFNPTAAGTLVQADLADSGPPVRGITSIHRVVLLRLEGAGMVGVPGMASRLFGALSRRSVNVILISQASSEHSICFAVTPEAVDDAARAIDAEFALERQAGQIDELVIEPELSIVAVVGSGMRRHPGVAGRLFAVLGEHQINVRAIAQGSSELNISLVVAALDEARAVRAIHDALVFPQERQVELLVAGVGRVGRTLLAQLAAAQDRLRSQGIHLRLTGVATRRGALLSASGLDPATAAAEVQSNPEPEDLVGALAAFARGPRKIFVDCTADAQVASLHPRCLRAGVAVVTANKLGLAGSFSAYQQLQCGPGQLYCETTVGAGLPIIGPLSALVATGDRLERLEGVLSGTLNYLTHQLAAGELLSRALRQAFALGWTEPDPREDLTGQDVARKLLILARVAGWALEPTAIEVESWLPDASWLALSLPEFWQRLPELDASFQARQAQAEAAGQTWRYLASLDAQGARVQLVALPADHPAASISAGENLIALKTSRYAATPLWIRGPGAGPEVTAAGVFADILRAAAEFR